MSHARRSPTESVATATARKTLRRHYGNRVARDLSGSPLCLASVELHDGQEYLLDGVRPDGSLSLFRFDNNPPVEVPPATVARVFVPADLR